MSVTCRTALSMIAMVSALVSVPAEAAPQVSGCPVDPSDYGLPVKRSFTDSKGHSTEFQFALPDGYDAKVPMGILMYLHGNDSDPDGTFFPSILKVWDQAQSHGLIPVVIRSIGTVVINGAVAREFTRDDEILMRELYLSNFGGCFALDRQKVYFEGESEGTCILSISLTKWLYKDFAGGVLGLCGCWGWGDYESYLDRNALRSRFKIFIENTTEDFLHQRGLLGMDIYKYNLGVDVRTDLNRSGSHCQSSDVNVGPVLNWMLGSGTYADPDATTPHWEQVDTEPSTSVAVAYDAKHGRFFVAVERPELSASDKAAIDAKRFDFGQDMDGYRAWVKTYPAFAAPKVFLMATTDNGSTWTVLAKLQGPVNDLVYGDDGTLYIATKTGLSTSDGTASPVADAGIAGPVLAVEKDDQGNLFLGGAPLSYVQRMKKGSGKWEALTARAPLGLAANARNSIRFNGGYLVVQDHMGKVHYSQDHGDTFVDRDLPETFIDFVNHGQWFYGTTTSGEKMYVSGDAGQTWKEIQRPAQEMLTLAITPEGHLMAEEGANLGWRSKDQGTTWNREPGFHNNRTMDFAFTGDGNAMAVSQRGIFRYRPNGIAVPDAGAPVPDALPAADAAIKPQDGPNPDSGTHDAAADAAPSNPSTPATTKSGCSCRTSPASSTEPLWVLLLLAPLILRMRRV